MERKATSRDNPWMSGLWMVAILGMVIGGVALFIGHGMTWQDADPDPALGGSSPLPAAPSSSPPWSRWSPASPSLPTCGSSATPDGLRSHPGVGQARRDVPLTHNPAALTPP